MQPQTPPLLISKHPPAWRCAAHILRGLAGHPIHGPRNWEKPSKLDKYCVSIMDGNALRRTHTSPPSVAAYLHLGVFIGGEVLCLVLGQSRAPSLQTYPRVDTHLGVRTSRRNSKMQVRCASYSLRLEPVSPQAGFRPSLPAVRSGLLGSL